MNRPIRSLVMAVLLSTSACASVKTSNDTTPHVERRTTLRVENQAFLDMTIYVVQGSARIRLGQVRGNTTEVLVIPSQYVFGPTSLQFVADPVGSSRTPVSDRITVSPGDQVVLVIPPS